VALKHCDTLCGTSLPDIDIAIYTSVYFPPQEDGHTLASANDETVLGSGKSALDEPLRMHKAGERAYKVKLGLQTPDLDILYPSVPASLDRMEKQTVPAETRTLLLSCDMAKLEMVLLRSWDILTV